jgi:hypothetical protein
MTTHSNMVGASRENRIVPSAFPPGRQGAACRLAIVLAWTLGLGSGCSTAQPPARTVASRPVGTAMGEDIQCSSERVTGSLVATRVCTFKSQRDAIREHTQDARDALNNQVIAACPGTPGCK